MLSRLRLALDELGDDDAGEETVRGRLTPLPSFAEALRYLAESGGIDTRYGVAVSNSTPVMADVAGGLECGYWIWRRKMALCSPRNLDG